MPLNLPSPVALIATAALALGLGSSFAPGHAADDEPPPEVVSVSGRFVPTATFEPYRVELCAVECLRGLDAGYPEASTEVAEDGTFTFDEVDLDSATKVLVRFRSFTYDRNGKEQDLLANGYLMMAEEELRVVKDFESADDWPLTEDLGELAVVVPEPRPVVTARFKTIGGGTVGPFISFAYKAVKVQEGTTIVATMLGCGDEVVGRTRVRGRSGTVTVRVGSTLDRVARKVPVQLKATKKGHRPSTLAHEWGPVPDRPRTC